jgi:hypothetical protein
MKLQPRIGVSEHRSVCRLTRALAPMPKFFHAGADIVRFYKTKKLSHGGTEEKLNDVSLGLLVFRLARSRSPMPKALA